MNSDQKAAMTPAQTDTPTDVDLFTDYFRNKIGEDPDWQKSYDLSHFYAFQEGLKKGREHAVKAAGEALKFYADTSKYPVPKTGGLGELYFDCGEVAKKALSELQRIAKP